MSLFRFTYALPIPLLLAACATPPPYQEPTSLNVDVPASYVESPAGTVDPDGWLGRFGDPDLQRYVDYVLARNLDIRQAAERVDSSRLMAVQAVGAQLPDLGASFDATRARSVNSIQGADTGNSYSAGARLTWEIDLWGKLRNSASASLADYQASSADYYAARLSLAATATRTWFNAVALHEQLELARRSFESYQNSARLIQSRYETGMGNALDLRLALANAASAQALVKSREQSYRVTLRELELLAAEYPAAQVVVSQRLPDLADGIPSGLPSDLLRRRPDIAAAERDYAAALQRAARARKDLLPSISLTGNAGYGSDELEGIFRDSNFVWNLVGGVTQPLLNGGALRSAAGIARNNADIASLAYAQTILDAFSEVEVALAAERYLRERQEALRIAMEQSKAAEDLAWQQYVGGIGTDIISVLESQRRSINAQTDYIDVSNARLQNRVNLHVALGGTFEAPLPDPENVGILDVVGP